MSMNILLNVNNFGQFYSQLKDILRPNLRVLILPLSYHEDWIHDGKELLAHYGYRGEEFRDIWKEFEAYGIRFRNVRILNYYKDSYEEAVRKIRRADVLFFTGGYPDKMLYRIDQLGIREEIRDFPGIVMGTSAGAMIQFDHYHVTPEEEGEDYEYHDGLGRLSGFDIEVHYEESSVQLSCMLIAIKETGIPIFAMPNSSGLICDGEDIKIMGDAFLVTDDDVDEMQREIDEREEE